MLFAHKFFKYAGVTCIPVYVVFTFVSHLFNHEINPMTNWLSDFGNPLLNPGAWVYNTGCIAVAVLLVFFYAGMTQWYVRREVERKYVICYVCAQISGAASSIFLVLASVFPLGTNTGLHSTFSLLHMIGVDFFLGFTAIAFFMNPAFGKWIGVLAYAIALFNVITTNAVSLFYLGEWIYFLLYMAYMTVITLSYDKLARPEQGLGTPARF